jgi:SPP1 family predicted phage head-tail adaptor
MRAGKLRHRLVIQRATTTQGSTGQPVKTWTTLATVWGDVKGIESDETEGGEKQTLAIAKYDILIRYFAGLTALDRLIHDGKVLEIASTPVEDGRKRWMTLQAREARTWV